MEVTSVRPETVPMKDVDGREVSVHPYSSKASASLDRRTSRTTGGMVDKVVILYLI